MKLQLQEQIVVEGCSQKSQFAAMRIIKIYAYIHIMKARLNLTIDEQILNGVKAYAASKNTSISELVEDFFKSLRRPAKRKTIIDLVEDLPASKLNVHGDLKKKYYEAKSEKYGF